MVGYNPYSTLKNCYNIGTVSAADRRGGVVGYNDAGSSENGYYLDTCGAGGVGTSLTAEQFKDPNNFSGWDFSSVWEMSSSFGRPVLKAAKESVFKNGKGTEAEPYLIPELEELEVFRDYINGGNGGGEFFKLTADIDMSSKYSAETGTSWTPIGNVSNRFSGNFDGDGHKISGLYINRIEDDQGLFGYVREDGTVKNLGVEGIVSGDCFVGGIVGRNYGKIEKCSNACTVSGVYTGGIVGINNGTIENCYNTGKISGDNTVGGVVGRNHKGTLKNCYNTGEVSGDYHVGGVVGNTDHSTIIYCYNTGKVNSKRYVSGIIGSTMYDTVTNCYYLKDTANGGIDGSDVAGQAEVKTAAEFATQSTFKNWDFDNVWHMNHNLGRPILFAPAESTSDLMYTVTIPEIVEIGGTATVKAENVSDIPLGSYLSVTLSDSDFVLRTDKGAELAYTVTKDGKQVNLDDTILAVGQGTEQSSSADLKFDLKDSQIVKYSGNYQGSVTFNVSIE